LNLPFLKNLPTWQYTRDDDKRQRKKSIGVQFTKIDNKLVNRMKIKDLEETRRHQQEMLGLSLLGGLKPMYNQITIL
jgi:hypothetical protein